MTELSSRTNIQYKNMNAKLNIQGFKAIEQVMISTLRFPHFHWLLFVLHRLLLLLTSICGEFFFHFLFLSL